jgi:hypothetical protein
MNRDLAEKLLGGHATGTLTEAERQALYSAALEHQDLFDALMDEEALRELLADPEAKAQLLAALAPAAPKVIPLWRRPALLGAAASLILAVTAGLAYLRSPEPLREAATAEAPKAAVKPLPPPVEAPAAPAAKAAPERRKVAPAPLQIAEAAPEAKAEPIPARAAWDATRGGSASATAAASPAPAASLARAEAQRLQAQDNLMMKKAEAARPTSGLAMEVVASAPSAPAAGMVGGVVGGVQANALAAAPAPLWSLEAQADGRTRVVVAASPGARLYLLKRGVAGVEVLGLVALGATEGGAVRWQALVRLAEGDALDLYQLTRPVGDPAKLPAAGPLEGFRARVHPETKK